MTALLLCKALLEVLFAAVVLRADPRRRENQMISATALLDAARIAPQSWLLSRGLSLTSPETMLVDLVGRIVLVLPILEFAYAYPIGRTPPRAMRGVVAVATILAIVCALHPLTRPWTDKWYLQHLFFTPPFIALLMAVRRNLALIRADESARGAGLVLIVLSFIYGQMVITFGVVRPLLPQAFQAALVVSESLSVMCYVVVVHTMLRYRLFRVRGVTADALLYGMLAVLWLIMIAAAGQYVIGHVQVEWLRGVCFAAISFVPLGSWLVAERIAPRLEQILLGSLDPRRRVLKAVLERVLHDSVPLVDAVAVTELTRKAIGSLCNGTVAVWAVASDLREDVRSRIAALELPVLLAEYLQSGSAVLIDRKKARELPPAVSEAFVQLGADALIAVRAHDRLWCALSVAGEFIDQETLDTASALADNLGNKLAHYALYERAFELQSQLETSRNLATLGSLTAAIAHDIRTPLTSMKMNLEMIRSKPDLDSDGKECADLALEQVQRMSSYVSGMLDYVKPVHLRPSDVDLCQLVDDAARSLQPLLEARSLRLSCHFDTQTRNQPVHADALRLRQVLINLLENAADASAPGDTISVSAEPLDAARVAIRITDRGQGIEPEHLDQIFEPFFTTRPEGTGLGLAIVNKLIRAHRGDVLVDSVRGVGTTFTVVLPVLAYE